MSADEIAASLGRIDRLLQETVLPFWYPVLAAPDGAFSLNHDATGRWFGPRAISLVAQSRLVWVAARLAASGIDPAFFGAAAERGARYLLDRMWDDRHGGFFWRVGADGTAPERSDKHVYGQAFALLALCERAATAGDGEAAARARALFGLLESRAHDDRNGGYVEWFGRDWTPGPADAHGPTGRPGTIKTLNTHMHVMDALRAYGTLTGDTLARTRLIELLMIAVTTIQRKGRGVPTDPHRADWLPIVPADDSPVSFGHMVELAWMVPRAAAAAGIPAPLIDDLARHLTRHAARFGLDPDKGGLFDDGPLHGPSIRRTKTWWTQAEALVAFLERWQATGDPGLSAAYLKTLSWIEDRQVDRAHGEWHNRIGPDGVVTGFKADGWKCAYHQVRGLLVCRELLHPAAGR